MSAKPKVKKLSLRELVERIDAMPDGEAKRAAQDYALKMYAVQIKRFEAFKFAPEKYIEKFLKWSAWSGIDEARPGQLEVLQACSHAVRQQIEKREFEHGKITEKNLQFWKPGETIRNWIRVESGNGIGKTKSASGLLSWFFDCFHSVVYTFAPSGDQGRLVLWSEIRQDRKGKGLPGRVLENEIKTADPNHFAVGRTASDAGGKGEERTKGKHHEFLLFLLDEAEGIPDFIYKAIETMVSGGVGLVVMFANPRTRSSYFHRLKKFSYVQTFRISSLYHPNVVENREVIRGAVMRDFVEKQIEKGCEVVEKHDVEKFTFDLPYDVQVGGKMYKSGTIFLPNPEFMWTILGIAPPTSLDKTVVSVGVYEAACKRIAKGGDVQAARVGVDAARSGADKGTVYIRWQDAVWRSSELAQADTYEYVHAIKTECLKLKEKGVTSLHIRVDAGYGSGVIDALRIDGELKEAFSDYQVFEVHFGGRAYNQKDFDNLVTEMYYEAAESLKDLTILSPPDALEVDLTEREFKFVNRQGKTRKILEPKDEFKKRTKRSPDDGDGLVMAVAPDYCFNNVTISVISIGGTGEPSKPKTTVDDMKKLLGL